MDSKVWLFSFDYYEYCQGTRDKYHGYKLVISNEKIGMDEAHILLRKILKLNEIEYDGDSIVSETFFQFK